MMQAAAATPGASAMPMLLIIGFAIVAGSFGARIFQRLRIPQVVGYILIGLLLGQSWLKVLDRTSLASLEPFTHFALGVIGFMIGGELHREVFKKHGRQFIVILLTQGLSAFLVVSVLVGAVAMLLTKGDVSSSLAAAVCLGLLFGAIASATAPAATVNVLWEYKTRGVLTTAIYAIVAMDDALALVLFSIAVSVGSAVTGIAGSGTGPVGMFGRAAYELGGAAAMGVVAGLVLNFILRRVRDHGNALAFIIGALALVTGVASVTGMCLILAPMALGATLTNVAKRRSREAFELVEQFAAPIYVLFFVMAGAHLDIAAMPPWLWVLAAPFVFGRLAAKILGAHFGARWVGAAAAVRKYLGLSLFCQGGVALGLAILAQNRFGTVIPGTSVSIGSAIIMIVTATTLLVEFIGPPCVKLAVKKAGEIGLNVTEEDLMESYKVRDLVDRASPRFSEGATLASILRTIAATEATHYPVVNAAGRLTGIISLEELKATFSGEGLSQWLVAFDLMTPPPGTVSEDAPLADAVAKMRQEGLECLPVIAATDEMRLVGLLELRTVTRQLSQEVLRRHQLAESR